VVSARELSPGSEKPNGAGAVAVSEAADPSSEAADPSSGAACAAGLIVAPLLKSSSKLFTGEPAVSKDTPEKGASASSSDA
jgi:hypothetical protein